MNQYSSDKVDIDWLSIDFSEGLADGTFLQEARAQDSWVMKSNARGRATRIYRANRLGTVTILVDQESALHQQLIAVAEEDRNPDVRDKVGNMVCSEPGIATSNYQNAFILTEPDESRGTDSTSFAWVFGYEMKVPEPKPNPDNLVGN